MKRPLAYICSPYAPRGPGQGITEHVALAQRLSRLAWEDGYWPCAPHLYAPQFLDDADPQERQLGLAWGLSWLERCAVIYVACPYPEPTPGMRGELARARALGLPERWPVIDCAALGLRVPSVLHP